MAGKTGPTVGPEILKERIARGDGRAVWLIAPDETSFVRIDLELLKDWRFRLRRSTRLREHLTQFLLIGDLPRRRRSGQIIRRCWGTQAHKNRKHRDAIYSRTHAKLSICHALSPSEYE